MTNYISFPGLGIKEMAINRVAFTLFGREIYYYGLIITLGMILACSYIYWRLSSDGLILDDFLDYAIIVIPIGVICARLYYVCTNSGNSYDSFKEIIAIWDGGLGIYGGIIGGGIMVYVVCRYKKINMMRFADPTALGVMIGQLIGRWGNFFNAEAYGEETTLPWRMGISTVQGIEPVYYHPTFLYESLWNLTGFIIFNAIYKKKKFDGQFFLMYVAWYGLGRFFIEGLRTDSLYVGSFRVSQVVAAVSFIVASAFLIYLYNKSKKQNMISTLYYPNAKNYAASQKLIADRKEKKLKKANAEK